MKFTMDLFAIVVVLMMASPAISQDQEINWDGYCSLVETHAEMGMRARQGGLSLGQVLGSLREAGFDSDFEEIAREVAMDAFDSPRYNTESYQQRAIVNFKSEVLLSCLRRTKYILSSIQGIAIP